MLSELPVGLRALDRFSERRWTRKRVIEPGPEIAIDQQVHPDWDQRQIEREAARRLFRGAV